MTTCQEQSTGVDLGDVGSGVAGSEMPGSASQVEGFGASEFVERGKVCLRQYAAS